MSRIRTLLAVLIVMCQVAVALLVPLLICSYVMRVVLVPAKP